MAKASKPGSPRRCNVSVSAESYRRIKSSADLLGMTMTELVEAACVDLLGPQYRRHSASMGDRCKCETCCAGRGRA